MIIAAILTNEFKSTKVREVLLPLFQKLTGQKSDTAAINGQAIMGMVSFHFMVDRMFENIIGFKTDEEFYKKFTKKITNLALYGLIGRK